MKESTHISHSYLLRLQPQHGSGGAHILTLLEDPMIMDFIAPWIIEKKATDKALMTKKKQWKDETRKVLALTSLGLLLPSSIAVGLLIGYLLDKIFGTRPWLLLIFLFFGTASGLLSLLRGLSRLQDEKEAEDTEAQ